MLLETKNTSMPPITVPKVQRWMFVVGISYLREFVIRWSRIMDEPDGYYITYKPSTPPCISFKFNKMKFIYCHYCVTFVMKSMNISND